MSIRQFGRHADDLGDFERLRAALPDREDIEASAGPELRCSTRVCDWAERLPKHSFRAEGEGFEPSKSLHP